MSGTPRIPQPGEVPLDFRPSNETEWLLCLQDPVWRLMSGALYKIMIKDSSSGEQVGVIPFEPNIFQKEFLSEIHFRSCVCKSRQLGFTTVITIAWLDYALFTPNKRCGIIAHSLDDAGVIFRDKVKFAYENLPETVKEICPLSSANASELLFANNSSIRVAMSMRSGTIHRLHISEMGKIAARFPQKAREIVTGSFPAVPGDGIAVIESTPEGREGEFYKIATRAEERSHDAKPLTRREWKFFFFPWWRNPDYREPHEYVPMSPADHEYFRKVEESTGVPLSLDQRAWYVSVRDQEFGGDQEKMWQEYASTPSEMWMQSTEGTYYARQLAMARRDNRIGDIPILEHVPVHTFWDIGASDGTAIWLMQHVGAQERFIGFIEEWGMGYKHFVQQLRETGYLFGGMYLPHDAGHERQFKDKVASPLDMLQELAPDWDWIIVPQVRDLQHGIELTRQRMQSAWWHEEFCKDGLNHVSLYRKKWNAQQGAFSNEPDKLTGHSEAADAFRQWAQGYNPAIAHSRNRSGRDPNRWGELTPSQKRRNQAGLGRGAGRKRVRGGMIV